LGVSAEELTRDVSCRDLAADSLDLLELALALEGELGIVVPEAAIDELRTYGDLLDRVQLLARERRAAETTTGHASAPALVWARVVSTRGEASGDIQRAGWLTPYTAETIAEDAIRAGRGAPRGRRLVDAQRRRAQSSGTSSPGSASAASRSAFGAIITSVPLPSVRAPTPLRERLSPRLPAVPTVSTPGLRALCSRARAGTREDRVEHRARELAGERVLLARVIRAEQRHTRREPARRRARARQRPAAFRRGRVPRRKPSCATLPSATTTASRESSPSSPSSQRRQVAISAGVGRFAGGAHRATAVTNAPFGGARRRAGPTSAGSRSRRDGARRRASCRSSPVKMRPVRFPPCAAGARPTTSTRAAGSPKPGTGRAQ
jgi:acyl carrier protein